MKLVGILWEISTDDKEIMGQHIIYEEELTITTDDVKSLVKESLSVINRNFKKILRQIGIKKFIPLKALTYDISDFELVLCYYHDYSYHQYICDDELWECSIFDKEISDLCLEYYQMN